MCTASLSNLAASPVVNLASSRPRLHNHSLAKDENVLPSHLNISCIQATLLELQYAHAQIYKTNLELSRVDDFFVPSPNEANLHSVGGTSIDLTSQHKRSSAIVMNWPFQCK